jgi:hypothetical protein
MPTFAKLLLLEKEVAGHSLPRLTEGRTRLNVRRTPRLTVYLTEVPCKQSAISSAASGQDGERRRFAPKGMVLRGTLSRSPRSCVLRSTSGGCQDHPSTEPRCHSNTVHFRQKLQGKAATDGDLPHQAGNKRKHPTQPGGCPKHRRRQRASTDSNKLPSKFDCAFIQRSPWQRPRNRQFAPKRERGEYPNALQCYFLLKFCSSIRAMEGVQDSFLEF